MTIPRSTAKKLCTDTEYRLVDESFAPLVSDLSEKGLAQRIKRARIARDKYRSLVQRQTREARGRIEPRGSRAAAGNKNTVAKQQLFDETLARYEKQAERAAQSQTSTRPTAVTGKAGTALSTKTSAKKTAGKAVKKAAELVPASGQTLSSATRSGKAAGAPRSATTPSTVAKGRGAVSKTSDAAAAKPESMRKAKAGKVGAVPEPGKQAARKGSGAAAAVSGLDSQSAANGRAKKTPRTPASRTGTITPPVEIPPLSQVVAAVSQAVVSRKEDASSATPALPARSRKAPAQSKDGAAAGVEAGPDAADNPNGPDFPRNPMERGRLGAAFKRQQARRDSR